MNQKTSDLERLAQVKTSPPAKKNQTDVLEGDGRGDGRGEGSGAPSLEGTGDVPRAGTPGEAVPGATSQTPTGVGGGVDRTVGTDQNKPRSEKPVQDDQGNAELSDGGFDLPITFTYGSFANVTSVPRDLDTGPYVYTVLEKVASLPTVLPIIAALEEDDNDVVIITNLTPQALGGDVFVNEDDLLASRGVGESEGSDPTKESTTAQGTFNISVPDGVDDLSVGGHLVITNGVFSAISFLTPLGNTLSIVSYDPVTGEIVYQYTLNDNEVHAPGGGTNDLFENFIVTVSDVDGDTATDTLSVRIIDDVPTAVDDVNGTASEINVTLVGNVLTNDIQGADGASITPVTLNGTYGNITILADGSYTYMLNTADPDFIALGGGGTANEVFTYTLIDTDGDTDTAKLTLHIQNNDNTVIITNLTPQEEGGDAVVDEDDLLASRGAGESEGSDPTKESTTVQGTFNINAPDGVDDLSVGGHLVITNGVFNAISFLTPLGNTLDIISYNPGTREITYQYTLNDNEMHPPGAGENSLFENFIVTLSDIDGDIASDTLSIRIIDDVPTAIDDVNGTASETNITLVGNVLTNDIQGADGASVTAVTLNGTYGSIVIHADGSYTYTLNVADPDFMALGGGGSAVETFNYTLTDTDGDADTGTLRLNIHNNDDTVVITNLTPQAQGGDAVVDEDDLLASRGVGESEGSDPTKESTSTSGTFNISALDGVDDLSIGGNLIITNGVFAAVSFVTPLGNTLNVTSYNPGTGEITYQYTLNDNEMHPLGAGENSLFENFIVTLSDIDGDIASDTLSIRIIDDVPTAIDDVNGTASETNITLVGNVLTNDIQGADGASITPVTLNGTYGNITILADGSYTYTLNTADPDFIALGGGGTANEVFTYTLIDTDGDTDTAILTLHIQNNDDSVVITNLTPEAQGGDAVVDEDDLINGSDPTKESTTAQGTFNINAPDSVDDLSIGGNLAITNGVFSPISFLTPLGNTLNIISYNPGTGEITYQYTLNDNEMHPVGAGENSLFENFIVTLSDIDGDTASDTLSVRIIDDVPTAIDDVNGTASETNITLVGNVLTNDIQGADGASVTPVTLNGTYGNITILADGSYTYTLNVADPDFMALGGGGSAVETFNYTLTDTDGDADTGTLRLNIHNNDDTVVITNLTPQAQGGDAVVDEDDLLASRGVGESEGSDPTKESTSTSGTFNISALDGVDDLSIGGNLIITNGVFVAVSFVTPLGNTLNVTSYNPGTGEIAYQYTLNDNAMHPLGAGENSLFENFIVTLSDIDGDTASDTLSIRIIDDVPTAVDDVNGTASETNITLVGNVLTNDIQGADGASITPVTLNGTYGNITILADGSYTYTLNVADPDFMALGGGGSAVETFNYTLTDTDGDADIGTLRLNIHNNDDTVVITNLTPEAQGGDAVVDEDDLLANRGVGESEGSDPTKESTTTSGTFNISAPDGVDDLSIGGNLIISNGVFNASSFLTPLGNTLNVTSYNPSAGEITYQYTLNDNAMHPLGAGENSLFENFIVTLSDIDGDIASDTLSIRIIDDVPTAVEDCFTVTMLPKPSYNLTFVIDISGSMNETVSGGKTRLTILKEALTDPGALLDSYQNSSEDLRVSIITFSSSATTSQEYSDIQAVKSFVNGLTASGTTNYQAAAAAASNDISTDGSNDGPGQYLEGFIDRIYFISDGIPNPASTALSDAQEATWRNLLNNNAVEAILLNIGNTDIAEINENLADLDNVQPGEVITVAPDLSNLQTILLDTITQGGMTGNVLSNDIHGADNNAQVLELQFTFASNQAAQTYINNHPELNGATVNGALVTIPIPNGDMVTPLLNKINLQTDGSFTYTLSGSALDGQGEDFFYTMQDNDGDHSTAKLCFDNYRDDPVKISDLEPEGGDVVVNENDLLASRGIGKSEGSDPTKESTTSQATFKIQALDGVDTLSIGGQSIITNGIFSPTSFLTPLGNTLNIISYDPVTGVIVYEYTLNDNMAHSNGDGANELLENFVVTLTDIDGDTVSDILIANIIDDIANFKNANDSDQDGTIEISALNPAGNIIHSVQLIDWAYGADGAGALPTLSSSTGSMGINSSSENQIALEFYDVGAVIAAVLTLRASGNDSLQLFPRPALSPDLDYSFTLRIIDSDGDIATKNFTLHLDGDPVVTQPGYTVDGPIVGATIFQDQNNNAIVDDGESFTLSDHNGRFDLMLFDSNQDGVIDHHDGRLVSMGGKDSETGLSYAIPLFAPIGSSVISPLTSLLQMQIANGKASTMTDLTNALGIATDTALMHLDPKNDLTALFQAAAIMTLSVQLSEAYAQVLGISQVFVVEEVYLGIGNQVLGLSKDTVADFSKVELLQSIIEDISEQLGVEPATCEPIMSLLVASQVAIANSLDNLPEGVDPVEAISATQHITQGAFANIISEFYKGEVTQSELNSFALFLEQNKPGEISVSQTPVSLNDVIENALYDEKTEVSKDVHQLFESEVSDHNIAEDNHCFAPTSTCEIIEQHLQNAMNELNVL